MTDDFKILIQASLDKAKSEQTIKAQLKQISAEVSVKAKVDTQSFQQVKQTEKEIQAQREAFNKKNMSASEFELKKQKLAGQQFAKQLKAQMQAQQQASKQAFSGEMLGINTQKLQQRLLAMKTDWSKLFTDKDLSKGWQQLFDSSQLVKSQEDLKKVTAEVGVFEQKVKAAGKNVKTSFGQFFDNAGKFLSWFVTGNIIAGFSRNVSQAVDTLKELDTILTEISKTSDRSNEELKQLGYTAFDTANKYGATAQGYLTGVQEMSRAGKANAEQLAEVSILAQSAGDMTADVANKYLLATDAAYKYNGSVEKLTAVLDGQNQVTNRNAINMEQLAEATMVAGSQAAQSQVSVDQLTAAVGTMGVVTQQGGDIAGRAFKGILMNLQQVKGETEDGEIIDSESLGKAEKACQDLGVSLKEVKDGVVSLRNPMTILKELSDVYNSLDESDARRANLISAVGGKYRGNQLAALLGNWDTYEKILSDYSNSTGSALQEAEKTANSWEGRLNKLTNTWNAFVQNFVDSDFVKGLISGGEGVIKVIDGIIGGFGGLLPLLTAVAGVIVTIKAKEILSMLKGVGTTLSGVGGTIKAFISTIITAKKEGASLSATFGAIAGSVSVLQVALGALTAALTIGFMLYNNSQQQAEKTRQVAYEAAESSKEQADSLIDLQTRYDKLNSIVDKTASQEEEFKNVVEDITTALGNKSDKLKGLTVGTQEYTEALREATKEELHRAAIDASAAAIEAGKNIPQPWGFTATVGKSGMSTEEQRASDMLLNSELGKMNPNLYDGWSIDVRPTSDDPEYLIRFYESAIELQHQLLEASQEEGMQGIKNTQIYKDLTNLTGAMGDEAKEALDKMATFVSFDAQDKIGIPQTAEDFANLVQHIRDTADSSEVADAAIEKLTEAYPNLAQSVSSTGEVISSVSEEIKSLEDLSDTTDSILSSVSALNDAFAEQNENGSLSIDTVMGLVDAGYAAALSFDSETGAATINAEAMRAVMESKIQVQKANLLLLQSNLAQNLINEGIAAGQSAKGFLILAEGKRAAAMSSDDYNQYQSVTAQISALDNVLANIGNITLGNYTTGVKKATDATKEHTDALKKQKEALQDQKDALEKEADQWEMAASAAKKALDLKKDGLNDEIERLQDLLTLRREELELQKENADILQSAVVNALQDEIDKLQKKQELTEKNIELEKYQQALARANDQKTAYVYRNGKFDWEADPTEVQTAQQDYNNYFRTSEIEDRIKALQEYMDKWGDVSDTYDKENAKLVAISKWGQDWESKILDMREDVLTDFQSEYLQIQENLTNLEKEEKANQERIQLLQDQIDKLDEYKQAWEDAASFYEDQQNRQMAAQLLGANWEADVLNGRVETVRKFRDNYSSLQGQIATISEKMAALDKQISSSASSVQSSANAIGNAMDKINNSIYNKRGLTLEAYRNFVNHNWTPSGYSPTYMSSAELARLRDQKAQDMFNHNYGLPGYATGGVNDKIGLQMLHGEKQRAEVIFNAADAKKLFSTITTMQNPKADLIQPFLSKFMQQMSNGVIQNKQNYASNVHIDRIELPNIRSGNDAQKLLTELKSLSTNAMQFANRK